MLYCDSRWNNHNTSFFSFFIFSLNSAQFSYHYRLYGLYHMPSKCPEHKITVTKCRSSKRELYVKMRFKIKLSQRIILVSFFLFIFLLNSAVSFHFKHLPSGCTLGYQGVYQMNIFAKQSCIPKNLLPLYLKMRSVSGWSDKALYPPIWQMWKDSDPIFHPLSLCLLGLAPTRTIRSPSQKKTKMFSFNRTGAG